MNSIANDSNYTNHIGRLKSEELHVSKTNNQSKLVVEAKLKSAYESKFHDESTSCYVRGYN